MKNYRITVREITHVEYSVMANSESDARELIGNGDQRVVREAVVDWDIIEVEEREQ